MNLIRPLWFTWKGEDGYGSGGGYLQTKIFYYLSTKKHRENDKSTGKRQGKQREFGINWSVATLSKNFLFILTKIGNLTLQQFRSKSCIIWKKMFATLLQTRNTFFHFKICSQSSEKTN